MEYNNFETILENWYYVLPPSRPSFDELMRIRILLLHSPSEIPIAILGSTVEYRDLLHQLGFTNIFIFDKNKDFYELSKQWATYPDRNEKFIEGDWLHVLPKYKNRFALILSDLTMGNVKYSNRSRFYTSIYNALMGNGIFFDKVLTHDIPNIPLQLLRQTYEYEPVNLITANRFNCEVFFCSELLVDGEIDTTKNYRKLENDFSDSPRLLQLLKACHNITPEGCKWYYGKAWSELKDSYFCSYERTTTFEDNINSPYYGRLKHFLNQK